MHKKIAAVVLAAGVLLGLSGCTPAAGNGEDTASPDTTTSLTDQAAVEESAETESVSEVAPGDSSETAPEETDTTYEDNTYVPAPPPTPTPIQPETPPADEPAGEEPGDGQPEQPQEPKGYYWPENPFFFAYDDPEVAPPAPNNAGTPEDYITVEYNVSDLAISVQPYGGWCVNVAGREPITIGQFNRAYPIECLRQVDEDTFYAVYKVEQGGYFYVHFQRMYKEPHWANQYEDGYYNGAIAMTGYSYVTEKRSSTDYAGIKIGDTINKVAEVDKAADFWKFLYAKDEYIEIRQYVTDGMQLIVLDVNDQGEFCVSHLSFYPGSIRDYEKDFNDPDGLIINTSILEQDFPG